jgi:TRAP-type C4-dicarboxylate transport system permease small subunit
MTITLTIAVLVLLVVNATVTVLVARANWYTRNQKLAQSGVVWVLPVAGAIIVFAVLRSNREHVEPRSHHVPETSDAGEYVSQSHGGHDP